VLEPGERLERWLVEDRFAGGSAIVYLLHDDEPADRVHERVAAKTVRPEFAADPARVAQFDHECYTWLLLGSHKHIVRLYSVDRFRGQAFALAEYVAPGLLPNTLRRWLDAGLVTLEAALRFGVQVCRAIEYARSRGVFLHQDLKPENVMITPSGVAKVTDWGLSRLDSPARAGVSSVGDIPYRYSDESGAAAAPLHGTRGYAAPECSATDREPTGAADIFSLAVCLMEMVTGSRPEPDTVAATIAPTLGPVTAGRASRLADALARCLSSRPGDRPTSTAGLQAAMDEAFEDLVHVPLESPPPEEDESLADIGQRAYALFMLGKVDEAMALQMRLMDRGEDNRTVAVVMDYKEAGLRPVLPAHYLSEAEEELRADPEDRERLDRVLTASVLSGKFDRAMQLYREWLERRPEDVKLLEGAAQMAQELGDSAAARAYLERAVDAEPDNVELWRALARLLAECGEAAEALAAADRAVALDRRDAAALVHRGHLLRLNGDREAAVLDFEAAAAIEPENAVAWFNLGTCQNELGRSDEASGSFSRAAELGFPQALNSLGGLATSAGQADVAIGYFERAISADPHYARPWFNLGQVREQLGQYDRAREAYEHALAIDSGYARAREALRRVAARKGW
jgi:tetratricopeptide (TPR) repeat protein